MALVSGTVNRSLPAVSGESVNKTVRLWRYNEMTSVNTMTPYVSAAEGSYFRAGNATVGTGVAISSAARASFLATEAAFVIINTSTDTVSGTTIYPDFLRLTCTATGTAGTQANIAIVLDTGARYSSGGTALTKASTNSNSSVSSIATIYYGAVTCGAASGSARTIGRTSLKTQAAPCWTVGDEAIIKFGDSTGGGGGTASGTAVITIAKAMPPVCIGPSAGGNHTMTIHYWATSQSATPSFEFELGWWER